MRTIKIAFFIDVLMEHMDGVSNTSYQIINRLGSMNVEPIFITALPPKSKEFPYKIIKAPSIKLPAFIPYTNDYPLSMPGKRTKIFKILDEFKPDLIHWSSPSILGQYATKYSELTGTPNITIYHTHFSSYAEYMNKLPFRDYVKAMFEKKLAKLYNKASLILAPTQSMKDYLFSVGITESKIGIWARGVDSEKFSPNHRTNDMVESLGGENVFKVLFVSRLEHYKETDMLIRLSHILPKNAVLIITGQGAQRAKMEQESHPDKTIFTGKLVGSKLSEIFASADVFVFPSLTDTFGNVVLEAMASGLPVVAAKAGGPMNIVEHGKTGFLLEPKKEDLFNEVIVKLMENKELHAQMSQDALAYARGENWVNLIKQMEMKYLSLLER